MITVKYTSLNNGKMEMSFKGLSTDTKPTVEYQGNKILNGSSFFEIDTQKLAFYDGESNTWLEEV